MGKAIFYSILAFVFLWSGPKLSLYSFKLYQLGKASETWVPVKAQLLDFKIESHSRSGSSSQRGGGYTTSVKLAYSYNYETIDYTGDRTGFGPYQAGDVDRPRRGKMTVYINPEDPAQSVYIKGTSKNNLGALAVGIGLTLAGLFFAFLSLMAIVKR